VAPRALVNRLGERVPIRDAGVGGGCTPSTFERVLGSCAMTDASPAGVERTAPAVPGARHADTRFPAPHGLVPPAAAAAPGLGAGQPPALQAERAERAQSCSGRAQGVRQQAEGSAQYVGQGTWRACTDRSTASV
jgi:hypothetical protein